MFRLLPESFEDRRWVVLGMILVQLALGAIYAWSAFTTPLKAMGWDPSTTQHPLAAGLISFAIVMVLAGRLLPKVGPTALTAAGGITLGVGYLIAGLFGGDTFWPVFLGVGVIGGAGIGLAYVVPIAVGMRWFPDKKGLVTGLAVAGFGFGAMGWIKLAGSWGHMLDNFGLGATFAFFGIAFMLLVLVGSIWMVFPRAGWLPAGYVPPPEDDEKVGLTSSQMLHTWQFYALTAVFLISAGTGLMSIGLNKLFPTEALMAAGFDTLTAGTIAGTAIAVFLSLGNGLGRIAWGAVSDIKALGPKGAIMIMVGIQGIVVLLFPSLAGEQYFLYAMSFLIGFNFGGNFALMPMVTSRWFGPKFIGQNYGWVFLAYGVGGVLSTEMGGKLGDIGNYPLAYHICGVACLVAVGIVATINKPKALKKLEAA